MQAISEVQPIREKKHGKKKNKTSQQKHVPWHDELLSHVSPSSSSDDDSSTINLVEVSTGGQRNLENEAENFARAYKRAAGRRCCYVNRRKTHDIMERCMDIAESLEADGPPSLFVIVLHESVCTDDTRMVPMLTYLEHLRGGWAFSTKPFRCKTLQKEPQVVVFAARAPAEKYVSDHWAFWTRTDS